MQPPELGDVEVFGEADWTTQPGTDGGSAEINSPASASVGPTSLREFLEQVPWEDDQSFRTQLDRRIMWALADVPDRAHEPMEMVSAEQQTLADAFVDALLAVRDWHLGDQTSGATVASHELAELQNALRRLNDPTIPTIALCSAVRGYGQYDEISPPCFLAGTPAEFVVYCELRDFVTEHRDDGFYYSSFDMTTTILNRAGDTVLELQDPDIVDRCRNLRNDCFIPRLVRLPTSLSPGRYVAKVTIVDKLGQNVTESRATFELVARP